MLSHVRFLLVVALLSRQCLHNTPTSCERKEAAGRERLQSNTIHHYGKLLSHVVILGVAIVLVIETTRL
jgi:hypothetical protein